MPMPNDRDSKDRPLKKHSHHLSWLLRHGAIESGLAMSTAGFAAVDDVLRLAGLSRDELLRVIEDNNKSRYELSADGRFVRASQGHSDGTPVTREGLEASWQPVLGDDDVFHGTNVGAARSILHGTDGIHAAARTHVHLAEAPDSTVGKRAEVDVLLAVSPPLLRAAGEGLWRAPNGVLLTRAVPRSAIVRIRTATRAGDRALAELQALLVV